MKQSFLKKLAGSPWFWAAVGLLAFRLLVVFLALNNFPPTEPAKELWWFYHGGDEQAYFRQAKALAQFQFPGAGLIGFPLLLTPLIWLFKPLDVIALAKPVVFLQGVIFYSLASVFVFLLAKKFLKKKAAFLITVFFNLYPYLLYYGLRALAPQSAVIAEYIKSRFLQLMFLLVLADPFSSVLVLGALLLFLKQAGQAKLKTGVIFLLGFLASLAAICRLQLALVLPFFGLSLLILGWLKEKTIFRKLKPAFYFVLAGLPLLLIQGLINFSARGSLFGMGYKLTKGVNQDIPMISFRYLLNPILYPWRYTPFLLLPLAFGLLLLVLGVFKIIREKGLLAWLLFLFVLFLGLPLFLVEASMRNPRYFLPVLPALFILIYAGFECMVKLCFKPKKQLNSAS